MDVQTLASQWRLRPGVTYLNHGSFGAVPLPVQSAQQLVRQRCTDEPMDFFVRQFQPLLLSVRRELAIWLGVQETSLALCENATVGMNELASWFPLAPGDEVLLNEHEYGAVKRIWQRRCQQSGAVYRSVDLPMPVMDPNQIVETILTACSDRTRLVITSHITSPSAIIMPVEEICARLRERGIATCIDGPHALLQQPVNIHQLNCDFYTASCHKWLCAPIGSGFLFVHPRWHDLARPQRLSWGRLPPELPQTWSDEFIWTGTRDYSPLLAIRDALDFFRPLPLNEIDRHNHGLAKYARSELLKIPGTQPLYPDSRQFYGWMTAVQLPQGQHSALQQRIWEVDQVEVPIHAIADRFVIRVSTHLYNTHAHIDKLIHAIRREVH